MNNRDPFNLRKTSPALSLLRNSAATAASKTATVSRLAVLAAQDVAETGRKTIEKAIEPAPPSTANMSYGLPQNGPTHRHGDTWRPKGVESGSVTDKMSSMFGADSKSSLPMYKDKPYAYPGSGRKMPIYRRKRVLAAVLLSLAGLSYWLGILSPLSYLQSGKSEKATQSKSGSSWGLFGSSEDTVDWDGRRERVKDAFKLSWAGYEKYAWGFDEFHPNSHTSKNMVPNGMGWIIVDALDTLMLMNMTTELSHARQWMASNLTYDQDHDVSTFETTIRMLGGLLSAHYLSTQFPNYAPVPNDGLSDDIYVEKATDLADRLLGAYDSASGVPYASVNLHSMKGIASHDDGGASSTAEATSVQLEMKYLSKLTGETHYWEKAEHVMKVVDDNAMEDGLLPIFIYADRGNFRGNNIRLGSRGDSYYEYLIKQYLQTSSQEPVYQELWNQSLAGVRKHLITYSSPSNFTILAERPSGLDKAISPKMDHLVCFMPGTIALGATMGKTLQEAKASAAWGKQQEEEMQLARELTKTCIGMYKVSSTSLAPEIAHFNIYDPPAMYDEGVRTSPETFSADETRWKEDYVIKAADLHNLQRPETVESLFYMWRITGDEQYRNWGWEMFQAFVKHTAVSDGTGFTSISNVNEVPPPVRDNMESFWLAETLKYFYLLFGPNDVLPLTDVVFNTEAHAFPKFELGKLFKTGWERRPRDAQGNLMPDPKVVPQMRADQEQGMKIQTVAVKDAPVQATSTILMGVEASAAITEPELQE